MKEGGKGKKIGRKGTNGRKTIKTKEGEKEEREGGRKNEAKKERKEGRTDHSSRNKMGGMQCDVGPENGQKV